MLTPIWSPRISTDTSQKSVVLCVGNQWIQSRGVLCDVILDLNCAGLQTPYIGDRLIPPFIGQLGGGLKYLLLIFTPNFFSGFMIHFDEHIFQMGW